MIRYARPGDHAAIGQVVEAAFGQPDEARLVERLRSDGDVLFELVAVEAQAVVGHILFSRLWADRYEMYAALAPVAVAPGLQNSGHGSALVRAGLESAKEFGAHGVLVLGHPAYYRRFGFSAEAARQISAPYAGSPAFMALALEPGAFDAPVTIAYPDAFAG
ncbi:N-acetyltransferase [Phenylobacterium sp.]|jgi:putative acetyltransferase|uniref:GNAT family N-acetyltransferase n=1 Tax=Phenylobacterium sp. TaxID=1871053 RepID=UPI002F933BDC